MTASETNTNIFCTFLQFICNATFKLICLLFGAYMSLVSATYVIQFFTWAPVVEIMSISDDSVQKMHRVEIKINSITERFWHATFRLP